MRIYKWSTDTKKVNLVTDVPWKPLSLAVDKNDTLLVVVEYTPLKGSTINGKKETYTKPDDAKGTSYGVWYNTGSTIKVYSINPDNPEETIAELTAVPSSSVQTVYNVYTRLTAGAITVITYRSR